ncbi:MAG: tetratricopeptide repeat protein [Pseudomonadota bacterium]
MSIEVLKSRTGLKSALWFCVAATFISVSAAHAKPSTKERVEALEQQVAELTSAAEAARAEATRGDQLEQQVRVLTGQVEELRYELDRANARIYSLSTALSGETPLDGGAIPGGTGFADSPSSGPVMLTDGGFAGASNGGEDNVGIGGAVAAGIDNDVQLPLDPDAAFEYANGFLFDQNYAKAASAFSLFVSAFGTHPRAADAQYRLGEALLAQDRFTESADAFVVYIKTYPDESRIPEAYLKLSASFAGLGETGEACKVLQAARAKYADGDPRYLQRADAALDRTGC